MRDYRVGANYAILADAGANNAGIFPNPTPVADEHRTLESNGLPQYGLRSVLVAMQIVGDVDIVGCKDRIAKDDFSHGGNVIVLSEYAAFAEFK